MSKRFVLVESRFGTGIIDQADKDAITNRPTVVIRDPLFAETMANCLAARARRCRCQDVV